MRLLLPGLLCLWLTACTTGYAGIQREPASDQLATVFYGTDRNRLQGSDPARFYGEDRGNLEYGIAGVSGAAEQEKTRLELVTPLSREDFLGQLQSAVRAAPEPGVLVFVHGYLRSFRQVSKLVAEFVASTGYQGVPLVWSWPSTTNPAGYTIDETNSKWARADFARFLQDVLQESGADRVHLLGHSLGGRGLSRVIIHKLLPAGVDLSRVGEVVLLAPDIDQEIFSRDIAPVMVGAGLNVTLYTSANDKALATARTVHGSRRAGDSSGAGPIVVAGVETIDVTAANRSILGHSYFEESADVASDLGQLLNTGARAGQRENLLPVARGDQIYWRLSIDQ